MDLLRVDIPTLRNPILINRDLQRQNLQLEHHLAVLFQPDPGDFYHFQLEYHRPKVQTLLHRHYLHQHRSFLR